MTPNPNPFEPTQLPALVPPAALLLRRAQTTLRLLRHVVQESSADYWYERGKAAKDRLEAAGSFYSCLVRNKYHWRAMLQLTIILVHQQKIEAAASMLLQAHNSCHGSFLSDIEQELSHDDWRGLQDELKNYKNSFEKNISIGIALAISCRMLSKPELARQELDAMSTQCSAQIQHSAAFYSLSGVLWDDLRTYGDKSSYQKSFPNHNRAVEIDPNYAAAYIWRAIAKKNSVDYAGALVDCNRSIALDPSYASAFVIRASVKEHLDDKIGAINDCGTAIGFDSRCLEAYSKRGEVYLRLHDYKSAVSDFEAVNSLDMHGHKNKYNIATISLHLAFSPKSIINNKNLQQILLYNFTVKNSEESSRYSSRAKYKFEIGDVASAIDNYDVAIQLEPDSSQLFKDRAIAKEKLGDTLGAAADRQKAKELSAK